MKGLDWDQRLSGQTLQMWLQLSSGLHGTNPICIPWCYLEEISEPINSYQLCGFCDASLKAYAAVVYLLIDTPLGRYGRILASKTRVSPLKTRLELLSALLLSRLVHSVTQALEGAVLLTNTRCFSDSTVAVYWIRGEDKIWKPFVQNRVQEIRSLVRPDCWSHCAGLLICRPGIVQPRICLIHSFD